MPLSRQMLLTAIRWGYIVEVGTPIKQQMELACFNSKIPQNVLISPMRRKI